MGTNESGSIPTDSSQKICSVIMRIIENSKDFWGSGKEKKQSRWNWTKLNSHKLFIEINR